MAVIGIDLGTTACKIVAYSNTGRILSSKRREYTIIAPSPKRVEINPVEFVACVSECMKSVVAACDEPIVSLSFSSQGEGFVALDREFNPVYNIILSYDKRSIEQTNKLRNQLGEDYFYKKTGQILGCMGTASKIMWLMENKDKLSIKPSYFVCISDFIISQLGFIPVIDWSLGARTMMLNIHTGEWDEDILDAIGIDDSMLPQVHRSGYILGEVKEKYAKRFGLPEGVIAVLGGHDQPVGMLGSGAYEQGEATYSLGTTETIVCKMSKFNEELKKYGLSCYPHILKNQFVTLAGNYTGGILLEWLCKEMYTKEEIFDESINDTICDCIKRMSEIPTGLLVLPHFTVTGSPWNDEKSVGVIHGLTLNTSKAQIIRGILEGITYEILLNYVILKENNINISSLIAIGGGTSSIKSLQLKADVLGVPIIINNIKEAACRGAALIAAVNTGLLTNYSSNWGLSDKDLIKIIPNYDNSKFYKSMLPAYKELYYLSKNINNMIIEKRNENER